MSSAASRRTRSRAAERARAGGRARPPACSVVPYPSMDDGDKDSIRRAILDSAIQFHNRAVPTQRITAGSPGELIDDANGYTARLQAPNGNVFAYVLREGSATMWWMPKDG
jgi:hypothetical protein